MSGNLGMVFCMRHCKRQIPVPEYRLGGQRKLLLYKVGVDALCSFRMCVYLMHQVPWTRYLQEQSRALQQDLDG